MIAAVESETDPLETAGPLAERFVEGVCAKVARFDDVYDSEVETVPTEAYDGFIPYTDGGYDGICRALMSYAYGSGCGPSEVLADVERSLQDAAEEFHRQHGITVDELFKQRADMEEEWRQPALPGIEKPSFPPEPELLDTWNELQDSWLSEGGTYFYKVRVLFFRPDNYRNRSGDYEVRMFAYLNTDYEYGRDSIPWLACYPGGKSDQTSGTWERTMTAAEFNALGEAGIDSLVEEATTHLSNL